MFPLLLHGTGYCCREDATVDEEEWRVQLTDARVLQVARRAARRGKGSETEGVASKSWTISFWIIEYCICITNKLYSHAFFHQQGISFSQVQLPPLQPPPPPPQWMHYTRHGSTEVCQTWSIIPKFILLLFISLNLVTSNYLVNYNSIWWLWCTLEKKNIIQ
jgi:hypothetical protein